MVPAKERSPIVRRQVLCAHRWRSFAHARRKYKRARRAASCSRASVRATHAFVRRLGRRRGPEMPAVRSVVTVYTQMGVGAGERHPGCRFVDVWLAESEHDHLDRPPSETGRFSRCAPDTSTPELACRPQALSPCSRTGARRLAKSPRTLMGGRPSKRPKQRLLSAAPVDTSEGVRHGRREPRVSTLGNVAPKRLGRFLESANHRARRYPIALCVKL